MLVCHTLSLPTCFPQAWQVRGCAKTPHYTSLSLTPTCVSVYPLSYTQSRNTHLFLISFIIIFFQNVFYSQFKKHIFIYKLVYKRLLLCKSNIIRIIVTTMTILRFIFNIWTLKLIFRSTEYDAHSNMWQQCAVALIVNFTL